MTAPIIYEVDRARDGGSFSNRRIVAIQHGRPIFNLAASFQNPEEGLEHQADMPEVPGPDGLRDLFDIPAANLESVPTKMRHFLTEKRPFEFGRSNASALPSRSRKRRENIVGFVLLIPCLMISPCTKTCSLTYPTTNCLVQASCHTG